ncbi:hypothetical protein FOWG_17089 [Fusarium oxysporum f. sp. lycopersici MN25]|nr:hypothetical protein FOWG_17089 [Fusarium oxysporum f. sp. lycopersici MN25]
MSNTQQSYCHPLLQSQKKVVIDQRPRLLLSPPSLRRALFPCIWIFPRVRKITYRHLLA